MPKPLPKNDRLRNRRKIKDLYLLHQPETGGLADHVWDVGGNSRHPRRQNAPRLTGTRVKPTRVHSETGAAGVRQMHLPIPKTTDSPGS